MEGQDGQLPELGVDRGAGEAGLRQAPILHVCVGGQSEAYLALVRQQAWLEPGVCSGESDGSLAQLREAALAEVYSAGHIGVEEHHQGHPGKPSDAGGEEVH